MKSITQISQDNNIKSYDQIQISYYQKKKKALRKKKNWNLGGVNS